MFLIIIAIAPTIALFLYFYNKDKYEKEPLELILKAFLVGVVILFPSVIVEQVLLVFVKDFKGTFQIFLQAFLVAGLVEESFKYMAFKILIYKNKNFNELYDGILYSVMVSLGFATFENLYYVLEYYLWGGFFSGFVVGIVRAILTIPLHCFLGVIMGYFLSLAKFSGDPILETKYIYKGLWLAIFLHGLFDFLVFRRDLLGTLLAIILLIVCGIISRIAIKSHIKSSSSEKGTFSF